MTQAEVLIGGKRLIPSDSPEYLASGPMSFEEFLDWEYEGGLTEWVNGEVFVYVTNNYEHQVMLGFLLRLLGDWAELTGAGRVITAPYTIESAHGGVGREPDLIFVSTQHQDRLESRHLRGAPDLAVEIVSPESVARDRVTKLREYERSGVQEYWVIDSRPRMRRAYFYSLQPSGAYEELEVLDGLMRSRILDGFWLKLEWLWAEDPKPLAALREIMGGRL